MNSFADSFSQETLPAASFDQVVHERRATRHFDGTPVPDQSLQHILEAARLAPSGYNLQPWRFLVLRDPSNRAKLRKVAFDQEKITEAPVVVVAYAPRNGWKVRMDDIFAESVRRGTFPADRVEATKKSAVAGIEKLTVPVWLNRHVMIAFTFMMLAAEAHGFDTAPMEGFDAEAVKKAFNLPKDSEVVALLAIGRARQPDANYPGRLGLDDIVSLESPDTPWPLSSSLS